MKEILFIIFLTGTAMHGQSCFVSAGGSPSEEFKVSSFSVGQVFYKSCRGDETNNLFITEGVQQPFELFVFDLDSDDSEFHSFPLDKVEIEVSNTDINFKVFPNPFSQYVTIGLEEETENLKYFVYDLKGQLISSKNISRMVTTVDLSMIQEGMYLMTIVKDNAPLKSFKIIKQQI